MARIRLSSAFRVVMGAGVCLVSCLPKDTRPTPGSVDVTVTADPLLFGGDHSASTADGWTVSYDRFLVSVSASLDGDTTCPNYYNDGYQRILDMGIPGPQKLNLLYSLGHCDFGFRVASADSDPYQPLGKSVTIADKSMMGTADTDPYTGTDRSGHPQPTGVAMYVKGRATKDAVTKTFAWSFRQRVSYQKCAAPRNPVDAGSVPVSGDAGSIRDAGDAGNISDAGFVRDAGPPGPQGIDLAGGKAKTVDIRMHGESLFLDSTNLLDGGLRFDILAAADDKYGNGDGDITLAELGLVPLADIGLSRRYVELPTDFAVPAPGGSSSSAAPAKPWTNLEDFVYLGLYPKVARFENTGICTVRMGRQRD
jgi:hypothetical protein